MSHHSHFRPNADALVGISKEQLTTLPATPDADSAVARLYSEGLSAKITAAGRDRLKETLVFFSSPSGKDDSFVESSFLSNPVKDAISLDYMDPEPSLPDVPIEPLQDNFEELALADDEEAEEILPQLTAAEKDELSRAAIVDRALDALDPNPVGQSPLNELISPSRIADPDLDYLTNPMPFLAEDGSTIPMGEELVPGHTVDQSPASPEDQAAVLEYMQGTRKELSMKQKNILIQQLVQTGGLEEALQGRSSSPALNQLFADIRRMQKRTPMLFGRPVRLKKRTSKTRKKKKH